jgi:hypothetical protein
MGRGARKDRDRVLDLDGAPRRHDRSREQRGHVTGAERPRRRDRSARPNSATGGSATARPATDAAEAEQVG